MHMGLLTLATLAEGLEGRVGARGAVPRRVYSWGLEGKDGAGEEESTREEARALPGTPHLLRCSVPTPPSASCPSLPGRSIIPGHWALRGLWVSQLLPARTWVLGTLTGPAACLPSRGHQRLRALLSGGPRLPVHPAVSAGPRPAPPCSRQGGRARVTACRAPGSPAITLPV